MDINFKNQILNDFSIDEEEFFSKNNIFTCNNPSCDFLFFNRADFSAICTHGKVFMRASNSDLIKKLREKFIAYPGAWFAEAANIKELEKTLGDFGLEIDNFFPLMTFSDREVRVRDFDFRRISKDEIQKFKDVTKMSFCFDEDDRLGLAYYDGDSLIALAGASYSGKYLWDIGLEKFSSDDKYQGLAASLLRKLSLLIREENPDISPITTTQFSHTKSINTSIRAGYEMNLCITGSKKIQG